MRHGKRVDAVCYHSDKKVRAMEPGKYYTVAEVSQMLRVSERQVRNWVERGELKVFRIGKRGYRISESALNEFIAQRSKEEK